MRLRLAVFVGFGGALSASEQAIFGSRGRISLDDGLAEFPRLEAYKLAVSVTVKGYRSMGIRSPYGSKASIRTGLEKWPSKHKQGVAKRMRVFSFRSRAKVCPDPEWPRMA
jgi:hypothetical protein